IYEAIYSNVARVSGYSRYYELASSIKGKRDPLRYILNVEDCYHGVVQCLLAERSRVSRVVEIGCGQGYLTYALSRHGFDAVGLDISREAIALAERRFGTHYFCGTLADYIVAANQMPTHVVCTELIEHLEDPVGFVRDLLACMPRGGKLTLTTPHKPPANVATWDTELPPVHLWWFSKAAMKK